MDNDDNFTQKPPQILITIKSPITGELLGLFYERNGVLTFDGKADESARQFVDFICLEFKERIEYLYGNK